MRILASVHHQVVIKYYDAFIESDKLYIVTELAKGGDIGAKVKRHLSRKELMSEEMIWGFFIQICQGLRNIHGANILHRDIKAANIFLVTAREVKIGDLGVAKITKGGMAHTQIGTPYYMSPEIWRNRPYNKKSDIWSLGCLLYELASLKHPFEARDEKGLAEKVLRGSYTPIPSQYSSDLSTMVKMLLVVDPARRPSIEEILNHPIVQARIADASIKASAEGSPPPSARHLQTIRVPRQLSLLQNKLPASKYPTKDCERPSTSAQRRQSGEGPRRSERIVAAVAQSVDEVAMRQAKQEARDAPIRSRDAPVTDKENRGVTDKENRGANQGPRNRLPFIEKAAVAAPSRVSSYQSDGRVKLSERPIPSRYAIQTPRYV